MKSRLYILILVTAFFPCSALFAGGYWQQDIAYEMSVRLDTSSHVITGDETIVYQNNSPDTLTAIYLHLLPNAFRDDNTVHSREGIEWYDKPPATSERSWIDINVFSVHLGENQSTEYRVDDTILEADLPVKLVPGGALTLQLSFTHHLRQHFGRAGYENQQYDLAQWYPKMAVYDQDGWDNDPWHYEGEFYGEFGSFEVTIDVPQGFIVGATGTVMQGDPGWDDVRVDTSAAYNKWLERYSGEQQARSDLTGRRQVTFRAEKVHDFAWSTSPDFVYESGEYKGTDIHVLYDYKHGRGWSKTTRQHAERALEWLERTIGEYPYPQVTVIDGLLGGGMEYPMLVMDGRADESLVVHEIGHIYFYGILGNNEMQEAWLDEGFTSFQTWRYLVDRYGEQGREPDDINRYRPGFMSKFPWESSYERRQHDVMQMQLSGENEPIAKPAFAFGSGSAYDDNVYAKAGLMLGMLEHVMGGEAFWNGMQAYFRQWQFRHVNEQRFREVMERHSDGDLDWFFEQWLHHAGYVDYALGSVNRAEQSGAPDSFRIEILKKGTFEMPVTVQVEFDDGSSLRKTWFGRTEQGIVNIPGTYADLSRVTLDPDNRIMDVNQMNNSSGLPRYEYVFDYPGINYQPHDAYVVEWRPSIWYNTTDGPKGGIFLDRHYLGNRRDFKFGVYAGAKTGAVDYEMRYSDYLYEWRIPLRYTLAATSLEGRQWNALGVGWTDERAYKLLPRQTVTAGFRNIATYDPAYFNSAWTPGVNNQFFGSYRYDFRGLAWTSSVQVDLVNALGVLGSDFQFHKLSAEWKYTYSSRDKNSNKYHLRTFLGFSGDTVPGQEKYGISDGGQYAYFQKFYARSRGSFLGLVNAFDHIFIPGDGNVRGYHGTSAQGADHLAAMNFELTRPLSRWYDKTKQSFSLFIDAAYAGLNAQDDNEVDSQELLMDAGIALSVERTILHVPFWMRLDLPLWLNAPIYESPESSQFDPRFLVSFEGVF